MINILLNTSLICSILYGHAIYSDEIGKIGIRDAVFSKVIYRVYKNTPAEKVGIVVGDKIISVIDEFGKHDIEGPVGSLVELTIKRKDQIIKFSVERVSESCINRK